MKEQHEKITQQEIDDDIVFQRYTAMQPKDFVNYALSRTKEEPRVLTAQEKENHIRATEYFVKHMKNRNLYDHTTYLKLREGRI